MQMTLLKKLAFGAMALCACVALSPAYAEEEAEAKPAAESEDVAAVAAKPEAFFYPLIRCHLIDGCNVQVLKPGTSEWVDAEEGRFYLNGSTFPFLARRSAWRRPSRGRLCAPSSRLGPSRC